MTDDDTLPKYWRWDAGILRGPEGETLEMTQDGLEIIGAHHPIPRAVILAAMGEPSHTNLRSAEEHAGMTLMLMDVLGVGVGAIRETARSRAREYLGETE